MSCVKPLIMNAFSMDEKCKFIPFHSVLHRMNFVSGNSYIITASVSSGTISIERCTDAEYFGYDIESHFSHSPIINTPDNLKNILILSNRSFVFKSPETGPLLNAYSKYYFLVENSESHQISISVQLISHNYNHAELTCRCEDNGKKRKWQPVEK